MDVWIAQDWLIRLAIFLMVLAILVVVERRWPRRHLRTSRQKRWLTNFSIVVLSSLLLRGMAALSIPLAAVATAVYAEAHGYGLFNLVAWPAWIEILLAMLLLDLAIWFQHLASHKIPVLWRIHQVHHADRDVDVTTALRFHPVEIALSMLWKMIVVLVTGVSVVGVVVFEIVLNACAMFNHANIDLGARIDRILRYIVVTPDMHRVHHSVVKDEHDNNYGFSLSIWDKLFGTYLSSPRRSHEDMSLGLTPYQDTNPTRLGWSLALPFRSSLGSRSIEGEDHHTNER